MGKYDKYLVPGTVVYFQGDDFIARAIMSAQSIYTKPKYGKKSQWHHIGFIGSDGYYYESTVKFSIINPHYGIKRLTIKQLKKKIAGNVKVGFQFDLELTEKQLEIATEEAQRMLKAKIKYGGLELFGTLWVLLKWKFMWKFASTKRRKQLLKKENPVNTSDVYCCAFFIDCFNKAKVYVADPDIDPSVTVVDETWLNMLISNTKKSFKV